jgi:arginase
MSDDSRPERGPEVRASTRRRQVDVIGVPFNSAGTTDGVARAPGTLRQAGLIEALQTAGFPVVDRGDLDLMPTTPRRDKDSHLIATEALGPMVRRVHRAVAASFDAGALPLVLGGDCPVVLGCMAAAASRETPRLLFVDGHEDAWPAEQSTTGEAADMELGWLLGRATDGLPSDLRREIPQLDGDDMIALGPRDALELAQARIESIADLVRIVRPEAVALNPVAVADWAASTLDARGPWWLHVDLDVLSTESLAAVDYQQVGGLDWSALTEVTTRAIASPALVGLTLTIYNPDLDPDGEGAQRIVRYLSDAFTQAAKQEAKAARVG